MKNKEKNISGKSKKKERSEKKSPKEKSNKWQEFLRRHSQAQEKKQ